MFSKEDHELLLRMATQLAELHSQLPSIRMTLQLVQQRQDEHERRIMSLERAVFPDLKASAV